MLLRELAQPNKHEIWVGIDGVKLCFGLKEFALVTGLSCLGSTNKMRYVMKKNGIKSKYFKDLAKVSKKHIRECFEGNRWESDDDAVKISLLHFLHNTLLSSGDTNHIPIEDFNIVDSGEFSNFPWGKEVFTFTVEHLKSRFGKKKLVKEIKDIQNQQLSFYRLLGFPYAFQIWFYESCPYLNGKFCNLTKGTIPRFLKWESKMQPTFFGVSKVLSLNVSEVCTYLHMFIFYFILNFQFFCICFD